METGREAEEKRIQIHIFPTFNYQNLYQNSRIRISPLGDLGFLPKDLGFLPYCGEIQHNRISNPRITSSRIMQLWLLMSIHC